MFKAVSEDDMAKSDIAALASATIAKESALEIAEQSSCEKEVRGDLKPPESGRTRSRVYGQGSLH